MHRILKAELLPLDMELERTLRNLNKVDSCHSGVIQNQQNLFS